MAEAETVPPAALADVIDCACTVVMCGIADAMYAARHAATKDSRPIGNAAAWRKFLDVPTGNLLAALDRCIAGTGEKLIASARQHFDSEEAHLAQIALAGAPG